jgi:putative colanic acid biosynthesis acetyltransferase WcaF
MNRERLVVSNLSYGNRFLRFLWTFVRLVFYRPSPRPFHAWRCFLLRAFGAKIGKGVHPYPSAVIWAPWNLEMGDYSCLADNVDCYCVAPVKIGNHATVSQYSFLCTAGHDYEDSQMPLVVAPIVIGNRVWLTADVFVGPGVTISDGAVVLARSSVFSNLPEWSVSKGNPALPFKQREMKQERGCDY